MSYVAIFHNLSSESYSANNRRIPLDAPLSLPFANVGAIEVRSKSGAKYQLFTSVLAHHSDNFGGEKHINIYIVDYVEPGIITSEDKSSFIISFISRNLGFYNPEFDAYNPLEFRYLAIKNWRVSTKANITYGTDSDTGIMTRTVYHDDSNIDVSYNYPGGMGFAGFSETSFKFIYIITIIIIILGLSLIFGYIAFYVPIKNT